MITIQMIFLYLCIVNTNVLYVILYFKQTNKTNTHVNFVQNQTNEQDKYTRERIVSRCNQILPSIDIVDNIAIPIPSVDRGHGDPRNIICLVTYFISDTEQYKLGTRHGLLNSTFPKNHFSCFVRSRCPFEH